MQMEN